MRSKAVWVGVVVLVAALGFVGWWFVADPFGSPEEVAAPGEPSPTPDVGEDETERPTEAPPAAPNLTGRPGIVLATNAPSWHQLLGTPVIDGVATLFVRPGSSSEEAGITQGDVITAIDGTPVANHEYATALLRQEPGQEWTIDITGEDGVTRQVQVTAEEPGEVELRDFYNPMVAERPDDLVLRFLRASAGGPFSERMGDIDHALGLAPEFVEAITLRGSLLWDRVKQDDSLDSEEVEEFVREAFEEWSSALELEPENKTALFVRSRALSDVGNWGQARRDAQLALEVDPDFPGGHHAFGLAEFGLGNYEEAAGPARRAIDLNPYDVRYYELLQRVFMQLGRPEACVATYEAIAPLLDEHPDVRARLQAICEEGPEALQHIG